MLKKIKASIHHFMENKSYQYFVFSFSLSVLCLIILAISIDMVLIGQSANYSLIKLLAGVMFMCSFYMFWDSIYYKQWRQATMVVFTVILNLAPAVYVHF